MRIITLHVDGLEQAVKNGLYQWLGSADVDVVAIQNLKAKEYQLSDDVLYPEGFNAYFFDAAEDNYSEPQLGVRCCAELTEPGAPESPAPGPGSLP